MIEERDTVSDKMSGAAAKMRRHRARVRAGLVRLAVEVDEVHLVEALVSAGLLSSATDHGRAAIEQATTKLLRAIVEEKTR